MVNRDKTSQIDNSPADMEILQRPDIILMDDKNRRIAVADVAIVFKDYQKNSFGSVRLQKEEMYQSLKTY